ncbi:unnamed protein product [Owenia fusiformis]|uniref:tRNA (guanine(26)-N(2))-dimethyltransferase n=1 Tax=Owenia fusiformis TaxID=6347 RepID=A0A8J1Y2K2_OWEFU|nr:unnamed protein product [Owenia fusiformis]
MEAESSRVEFVEENGIKVRVEHNHDKPGKCKTFFNPKMKICRELVVSALAAMIDSTDRKLPLQALDSFGATGILGMLLKAKFGDNVDVSINDLDPVSMENIKVNCQENNLKVKDGGQGQIEVINLDARILLHQRQYDFVCLDPYGTVAPFLDPVFHNVRNKGVVVLVSTDVAGIYGKFPNVAERNYGSYLVKTDYFKELAARVVIGAAMRSAARCNKGLEVLCTVAVEHFVLTVVKICRGPTHADRCLPKVHKLIHCHMCQDRAFYPETHTPIENPYSLLQCVCKQENLGKTAVELGPFWSGPLYNTEYLHHMLQSAHNLQFSQRLKSLLETLIVESLCLGKTYKMPSFDKPKNQNRQATEDNSSISNSESNELCHKDVQSLEQNSTSSTQGNSDKTDINNANGETDEGSHQTSNGGKRPLEKDDSSTESKTKKLKLDVGSNGLDMPLFFQNVHTMMLKGCDLPKANKLVAMLHTEGYRAARTHFEPHAVRTNATLTQLADIIKRHWPSK